MYGAIDFASDIIGIVCNQTFPGPFNVVKNRPSPPKSIFEKPFIISISMDTLEFSVFNKVDVETRNNSS